MCVSKFSAGHGTDPVDVMDIIRSKIPKDGKENADYLSYP